MRRAYLLALFVCAAPAVSIAADLQDCREMLLKGEYAAALKAVREEIKADRYGEAWRAIEARCLVALGRHTEAAVAIEAALQRYSTSVRLLMLAHDIYADTGRAADARQMLERLDTLGGALPLEYRDADDLVALGRAALALGADPKVVLDGFFDLARRRDPFCREAYFAAGEVALAKHDYRLASRLLGEGIKRFDDDADLRYAMARAFFPSDREKAHEHLDAALEHNPNHIPALLLKIDDKIDGEEYKSADKLIDRVLRINGAQPDAWAFCAVLAHLRSDTAAEKSARENALKQWAKNPCVDHLIGRKLSQKYRFAEGAAYQRLALVFDPRHAAAKLQLAQDLLRLGDEAGWKLAEDVQQIDPYNVTAFNLATLRDHVQSFVALKSEHFTLKMEKREAAIYGDAALKLLEDAHAVLTKKYGLDSPRRVFVEIFPDQRDFAIRTFGLPGGVGYLGVCFGNVITANSPAAQGAAGRNNWQAVLWHEYCHVVTLRLTRNKMPRWLSEGISVYEELQRNPAWGQTMNPRYRKLILDGELSPIGEMSAAFMSGDHIDFAYYQSSLAVAFLIETFGLESVQAILRDIEQGVETHAAIEKHTAPMKQLETSFAAYAKSAAESLAPGLDFAEPGEGEVNPADTAALTAYLQKHPNSHWGLTRLARRLVAASQWSAARAPLERLVELYPDDNGPDNPYIPLATVYRNLGDATAERRTLAKLAHISGDAVAAYTRLMDLDAAGEDWAALLANAQRYLAVNPLVLRPYQQAAVAARQLGRDDLAIDAYRKQLLLDPPDPAQAHYQLALLLEKRDPAAARRHVLDALEEAPRFRAAHTLLLRIARAASAQPAAAAPEARP